MLRLLALVGLAGLVAALFGSPPMRRVGIVLALLMLLYAVLKLTGVIDDMRPDRIGVSGYPIFNLMI